MTGETTKKCRNFNPRTKKNTRQTSFSTTKDIKNNDNPPPPDNTALDLGEGQEIILRFGNLHVAKGVRGHANPKMFLKWCNLVRFWSILGSKFDFKNF